MALTTSPVPQELIESIIWAHKVVVAAHVLVGVGFRLASSTSTGMFNLWIAGSFLATHNGGPLFCTSCPRRRLHVVPIVGMTPEWLREDASVRSASAYRVGREVMLGGYTFSRWALDMQYVLLLGCVP